jgi:hypothetical protein
MSWQLELIAAVGAQDALDARRRARRNLRNVPSCGRGELAKLEG